MDKWPPVCLRFNRGVQFIVNDPSKREEEANDLENAPNQGQYTEKAPEIDTNHKAPL
jgi:hypothetical protein